MAGRELAEQGSFLDAHLFNPPLRSFTSESARLHSLHNLALSGLVALLYDDQQTKEFFDKFMALKKWQKAPTRTIALPDGLPPHHSRTTDVVQLCYSICYTHAMLDPFLEFIRASQAGDAPVTCIIADMFVLFAQDAAKTLSVPYVAFWTQSAASYTCVLRVENGYRPPQDPDALITCVPGIPPLKQNEMNTFLQCYDPTEFMFNFFTSQVRRIAEADWILMSTFHELEAETIEALQKEHNVSAVGPLLPHEFFQPLQLDARNSSTEGQLELEECLKWLEMHSPASVVYVSFGSIAVISREQFIEFALGLEASGQPFLWVLRKDLIDGASAVFPDGFAERTRGRACFVSWVPQLKVLRHPSIGGFLTHCGWNSVLESVSAGVPLLCWAYFSDQMMKCRCVVDSWKVGLRLETTGEGGYVGKLEIKEKVRELLQEETGKLLRKSAQEWRQRAIQTVQQGGGSFHNLELFMRYMGHIATQKKHQQLGGHFGT